MNILLILLILVGLYLVYTQSKTKDWKKLVGTILLAGAILFIEFTPDLISFGAYAITHNLDLSTINASNISSYLLGFEIWSITIGILMLVGAMYFLKWDLKKVWKKLDIGKYKIALVVAFFAVLAVSLITILATNIDFFNILLGLKLIGVLIIFAIPALLYYWWAHKDKSEALGIFLFSNILYFGGLNTLGYYLIKGLNIPTELPQLIGNPFVNFVSTKILGASTVTNVGLLVSVFLSFIIAFITAKILKEKF